jgi:hypothetical protein
MRITVACPQQLQSDSNQLAMCLALSVADVDTYKDLSWQDAAGNLYAVASFPTSDAWIHFAQNTLNRPAWDVDSVIDMDAVVRAQNDLVFSDTAIEAIPNKLTACLGDNGLDVLLNMGLFAVPSEEGLI